MRRHAFKRICFAGLPWAVLWIALILFALIARGNLIHLAAPFSVPKCSYWHFP